VQCGTSIISSHYELLMAETPGLEEDEIDFAICIIDKDINIHVPRQRSTDLVNNPNSIAFLANAHLTKILKTDPKIFVKPNTDSIVLFDPPGEYFGVGSKVELNIE
jgi:hypothetical protein